MPLTRPLSNATAVTEPVDPDESAGGGDPASGCLQECAQLGRWRANSWPLYDDAQHPQARSFGDRRWSPWRRRLARRCGRSRSAWCVARRVGSRWSGGSARVSLDHRLRPSSLRSTHLTGKLVLSEFAGAATELRGAFMVNPHDLDGIKEAIGLALDAGSKEVKDRILRMRRKTPSRDVHGWAQSFLGALQPDGP